MLSVTRAEDRNRRFNNVAQHNREQLEQEHATLQWTMLRVIKDRLMNTDLSKMKNMLVSLMLNGIAQRFLVNLNSKYANVCRHVTPNPHRKKLSTPTWKQ
jgi:hypothetical protein